MMMVIKVIINNAMYLAQDSDILFLLLCLEIHSLTMHKMISIIPIFTLFSFCNIEVESRTSTLSYNSRPFLFYFILM